jgi:hypothetical protein
MRHAFIAAALALAAAPAAASGLLYSMPNGSGRASGGTFNYWDVIYSAPGAAVTTDGAPLSGGAGKLTDGVTTTARWDAVSNNAGTGPYVGWNRATTPSPDITFFWPVPVCLVAVCDQAIDAVRIWMDNSAFGGVQAPASIAVNGQPVAFARPVFQGPVDIDLTPLRLTGFTAMLGLEHLNTWIFFSEVEWTVRNISTPVPVPAALGLFGVGLLGLIGLRVRRPL